MANKPASTDLPIVHSNEVPFGGGAAVPMDLAQTDVSQATGFKTSKSLITRDDGSKVTEYKVEVGGTYMYAEIGADGSASLNTTRGKVRDGTAEPSPMQQQFTAAMTTALGHAPGGTTSAQEAKDLATVMEAAFADGKISKGELTHLTELSDAAQNLPATGPRRGGNVR